MSAVGGVAGVGRKWWDGGWEGWLGSQRASLGLPVPSSPPPETPSSGHTSVLAILCTGLAPLASRPFHILFPPSAVPFPQTSLLSFGLSSSAPAPTRCPLYLQGEVAPPLCCPITAHVSPLGYPTTLHTPRPCCVFLLWTDTREPGSWSRAAVGIAWLLGRELRTSCGFLAWVEG